MKRDLKFIGYFMTVNSLPMVIDDFKNVFPPKVEYKYSHDEHFYIFTPVYKDDLLFIPINHGSPFPRPDNVRNSKTFETKKNPRSEDDYEERQSYALIDFKTGFLWLSNTRRKIVLWTFFQEKLKTTSITIKEVYNEKDFEENIKFLDGIKFSAVPANLFSGTSILSEAMKNELHGFGAAMATIEFKYSKTKVIDILKDKISSLLRNKSAYNKIVISGKDEQGKGMLFSSDAIMQRLIVKTNLNSNGTFNDKDVFSNLQRELK